MNRPPLLKKGKNGLFDQFKKKIKASMGSHQDTGGGMMGGQTRPRTNLSGGSSYQKNVIHPLCVCCEQRHLDDCSVSLWRCLYTRERVIDGEVVSI